MAEPVIDEAVAAYWLAHYIGLDGRCVLCRNSGIIPRDGLAPELCFCPNGQTLRALAPTSKAPRTPPRTDWTQCFRK